MNVYRIVGGRRICGTARICAAKNAVLPILAAALLTDDPVIIQDCPHIADVDNMIAILQTLGCKCICEGNGVRIDPSGASSWEMPQQLSKLLRSSIFMMGSILGRFRKATVTYPGGCEIGQRPIDLHLKGLRALGVSIREAHGMIYCDGSLLRGGEVHLDFPSVGATENVMMAAALAPGCTIIRNAAREPEIRDLERFMNSMGAKITGGGTDCIRIEGVKRMCGTRYQPLPDRIVAGTLLTAAAMTKGEITLENVCSQDLSAILDKLRDAGCTIATEESRVQLKAPERPGAICVNTQPFPGFPTDMQAQIAAMCAVADGTSVVVENVFENRFSYATQLRCMGADILLSGRTAVIRGDLLTGARVTAKDLRGGAALTLAGLCAEGVTEVEGVHLIDRGYENLDQLLSSLGADIRRI